MMEVDGMRAANVDGSAYGYDKDGTWNMEHGIMLTRMEIDSHMGERGHVRGCGKHRR